MFYIQEICVVIKS